MQTDLKERYLKAKRDLFDKYYGARLNPEQRRAVFTANGPLLVLAGAGSGKTTVLVNRIAYLIKYGNAYFSEKVSVELSEGEVSALEAASDMEPEQIEHILPEFIDSPSPPWTVLAITFTNKAAGEIRERLSRAFDDPTVSEAIWAGTFHSVCLRILRKYGERLGYRPGFSIYDTEDKKRMISICQKELLIDEKRLSPKAIASEISRAKDMLLSPDDLKKDAFDARMRDVARVYSLYQEKLMQYNAVDFDDIIAKTVELLNNDPEVRAYYQRKFNYVLVDEYQDTNYAQFVLTSILADGHKNIMVVGDDDQSIYRFRGATVENILNFDKTYPDATVVKLEQNYRSTETILEAANAVIRHNEDRHQKSLWSSLGVGEKITLRECSDKSAEGKYIIEKITRGVRLSGRKYSDYAVLYRVNELARSLEESFGKSGMPYKILGSMRFYDRKEIRDMIAYLTVINSSGDDLRLKRIINEPKRKIGAATVEAMESIAASLGISMYEVAGRAGEFSVISKSADKLCAFYNLIEGFKALPSTPSELIETVFERTGYHDMLKAEGFEGEGRIDGVREFITAAVEYEKRCSQSESEPTLSGFLEEVALISDVDRYDENADAVVLMTIHAAKGLEFPIVFIAGAEDGIFPGTQNLSGAEDMSEERRLMYVALTRAKEKIFITHTRYREMYGRSGYNPLSVFVREELPRTLIEREAPERIPPRSQNNAYMQRRRDDRASLSGSELMRKTDIFEKSAPARRGAESYGIERLKPGTRVCHPMFGEGEIIGARDMGGDILYDVKFDTGMTKKLMATFAKLKKL